MNKLPQTPYEELLIEAADKGRLFRQRGGAFRTTQAIRDGSILRYFRVLYPPAQYSSDGVLIPQEPEITNQLVGIEKICTSSNLPTSHEPLELPPQHVQQEQDRRHPALM